MLLDQKNYHPKIAAIPKLKMTYFLGNLSLLDLPAVYFGGVRTARTEDLEETYSLAYALAEKGWVVVSGAARGVDDAAHCGALDAGGKTIILPVEGLDVFRFSNQIKNRDAHKAIDRGDALLLSFCEPKSTWFAGYALARNTYCLHLSQAMISVQSHLKGGTWDASLKALKMKVPLYIFKPSDDNLSHGAQYFIAKGAKTISLDTLQNFDPKNYSPKQNGLF